MGYTKEQRAKNAQKKEEELKKIEQEKVKIVPTPAPIAENKLKSSRLKRELPLNTLVEVRNGFNGKLVYVSKKNAGYTVVFDSFGDSEYFELQELVSARNSYKKFFEHNWFLIDDPEILEFLNVEKFYENAISNEDFDKIFDKPEKEIIKVVDSMSKGQKSTLMYRAKQLIDEGVIDSLKLIDILERVLETELVER